MSLRSRLVMFAVLVVYPWTTAGRAAEPKPIPPEQFEKLHKMMLPQLGENRFHDIPWLLSIHEARQKAATEGKPILVWSGAGGPPIAIC